MNRLSIAICVLIPALIATIALAAGVNHNAMGEFCIDPDHQPCDLDLLFMAGIWLSWFLGSAIIAAISILFARAIRR